MKTLITLLFFLVSLVGVSAVQAAPDIGLGSRGLTGEIAKKGGYETAGVNDTTLSETIGRIIKSALALVGTIFMALTVYAGFLWMTASGNEEQVAKAKGILRMAIIGLVITLASYGTTVFIVAAVVGASQNSVTVGN